jgi:hypothetical protein
VSLSQGGVWLSCRGAVELGILLPHLAGVVVEGVAAAAGLLLVLARAKVGEAACPACGTVSDRMHSRYARRLADAAIGGRRVVIRLSVRRFFCASAGCQRRTFAEQVPGLTAAGPSSAASHESARQTRPRQPPATATRYRRPHHSRPETTVGCGPVPAPADLAARTAFSCLSTSSSAFSDTSRRASTAKQLRRQRASRQPTGKIT